MKNQAEVHLSYYQRDSGTCKVFLENTSGTAYHNLTGSVGVWYSKRAVQQIEKKKEKETTDERTGLFQPAACWIQE